MFCKNCGIEMRQARSFARVVVHRWSEGDPGVAAAALKYGPIRGRMRRGLADMGTRPIATGQPTAGPGPMQPPRGQQHL